MCTNDRGPDAPRPSCAQRDGLSLYQRLKERTRELGLRESVLVTRTGCQRRCSHGVTVVAWPGNRWHGSVTLADAEELLDRVVAGDDLERRRMPEGPWE